MNILHVECYAGYRGDERPLRFRLGERTYEIQGIEDRWYSPSAVCFRVRADDGNLYVIRHNEPEDNWTLESFRVARP